MKSQVNGLLHVMQGLLKDVRAAYPALRGLELDYKSLTRSCQTRGLSFLTIDLPNLGSLLLQGLDNGRLELSGPVSRQVSKSVKVPRLFAGLWLRVFDKDACLKPDADVNSIFFLRSLCDLGKKLEVECSPERIQSAMENYHDIERRLRSPSFDWDSDCLNHGKDTDGCHLGDCLVSHPQGPLFASLQKEALENHDGGDRGLLEKIQQVADLLLSSFDDLCPVSLSGLRDMDSQGIGFRHGRGAVAERKKNWEKSHFSFWPSKLEGAFPFRKCGTTAGSNCETPKNHETPSRLHCVPKTAKSPRLIAAEPVAHQWCQQAVLSWFDDQFREKLDGHFIDLHDQGKSGAMVLQASLTREMATVDLSDASDRVSCWTVERIFRSKPDILYALHAARTRYVRDDVSRHKGFFKTKKFASQGTATTFPVMSFIMLCIALGSCIQGDVNWYSVRKLRHRVRVFGDDIILPTHGYARLSRAMVLLQLKINEAKSYVNGHFRESCGVDGFMGYDVTPVKPKTITADTPASCQAVLDYSNNLFNKGLWHASQYIAELLPFHVRRRTRIVGKNEAGVTGFTSFCGGNESHLETRWNPRLHRFEVRVWTLSVPTRSRNREGFEALLDFLSKKHSVHNPRIVSEYLETRKSRDRLSWEPASVGRDLTIILGDIVARMASRGTSSSRFLRISRLRA